MRAHLQAGVEQTTQKRVFHLLDHLGSSLLSIVLQHVGMQEIDEALSCEKRGGGGAFLTSVTTDVIL